MIVLLYSKYSTNCQRLIERIQSNRVQIPNLQTLCIDNKNIRKRIQAEKVIGISVVPCILSVFENGTVEKYEGDHSFQFVEQFIPKPEITPVFEQQPKQVVEEESNLMSERFIDSRQESKKKLNRNKNYAPPTTTDIEFDDEEPRPGMNPSEQFQRSDRNITKPQPRQLRNNDMSVEENEDFFSDDQPETRRPAIPVKKDGRKDGLQDPHGTTKKAADLQKERDMMDEGTKQNRPMNRRNNMD